MRHQSGAGPAAAGVGAEAGLQARPDVAEGEVPAVAHLSGLAGGARWLDAPRRATQDRLEHHPAARGQRGTVGGRGVLRHGAHHLVSGDEGEGDDVLEVARAAPVQGGQVRAADAREHAGRRGPSRGPARAAPPARSGAAVPTPAPRPEPKDDTTRAAAKRGSERSKSSVLTGPSPPWASARRTDRAGAAGANRPRALAQCSTCQPRRRAMVASRDSGLTATGKPTASSMARSLAESA